MSNTIRRANARLPPEVNRSLFVKNLPFKITTEEMYDIFGKYGAIRQIRLGNTPATRGRAFVVYEDIFDAKNAVDHLSGFNVCGRYIIVLYHNTNNKKDGTTGGTGDSGAKKTEQKPKIDLAKKKEDIQKLKEKYGV